MVFSLAMNNYLFQFFGILDYNGRIFKMNFIQSFAKFLVITFALSFNCSTVFRFRKFNSFIFPVIPRNIKRVTGFSAFKFYKCSDITCVKFRNPGSVLAGTYIKLLQSFFCPVIAIYNIKVFSNLSGIYPKIMYLTDMLFN